jgi:methylenetetrahydrofolate dehydrogenase (NADP+)/methenyltetrahydrofolate cyclohydrolase
MRFSWFAVSALRDQVLRTGGREQVCKVESGAVAATSMKGAELAARIREEVAAEAAELEAVTLATVLVGDDPASHIYIDRKHEAAQSAGIETRDLRFPSSASEAEVLAAVVDLNADDDVDGILVQLPLPSQVDEVRVTHAVDPVKDVDGFHPVNAGHLYLGTPLHIPATAWGCMELLREYGVTVEGADAVVIGRSEIVGRPTAMLLVSANATVTICHSRTRDLAGTIRRADIVVAAVGRPWLVTPDMVKPGAAVLDVGINRTDEGLRGDVDPAVAEVAGFMTPVPGGVGPMTIAMLLRSTLRAARFRRGTLAFQGH